MSTNTSTPSLLTSSYQANWTGVFLEHYLYPAYETPEHTLNEHHICLYVGKPLIYEQIVNGKLRSLNCIYGDLVIYPAGLTQKLSWNKNAEIIQLDINPVLLTQACQDAPRSHKLELIPQYGINEIVVIC